MGFFSPSLSLTLSKVQHLCCPHTTSVFKERNKPAGQRGRSGRSGCLLFNPSSAAQANSPPPPFSLSSYLFFPPFGPRNIGFSKKMVLQLSLLIILSLILKMHRQNVANKIVIYPHHASKRLQVSASCSTSSLRAGVWSY